jgi:hypothetical protein
MRTVFFFVSFFLFLEKTGLKTTFFFLRLDGTARNAAQVRSARLFLWRAIFEGGSELDYSACNTSLALTATLKCLVALLCAGASKLPLLLPPHRNF